MNKKTISDLINQAIRDKKITQTKLAEITGIKQTAISRWVIGKFKPDIENLKKISKALNKPISYFLDDNVKEQLSDLELIKKDVENINLKYELLKKELELLKSKLKI
jgi:transcriptional regulator with XRE-family HTH domain